MILEQAIELRRRQLSGEPIHAPLLAEAMSVIGRSAIKKPRSGANGRPWALTEREFTVLQMMTQRDRTYLDVANELGLSGRTVGEFVSRAKTKIGADNAHFALLEFDRWAREQESQ